MTRTPISAARCWAAGPTRSSRRDAFTLAELLVVMAIVVLMTAVAAPSFINLLSTSRLRAGARGVLAQCRFARDLATRQRTYARVRFDAEAGYSDVLVLRRPAELNTYDEAAQPTPSRAGGTALTGDEEWIAASSNLGAPRELPDGVEFERMASRDEEGAQEITFAPDGRGEDFFLTLQDGRNQELAVYVNGTTGNVRIVSPDDEEELERLEREFGS